MCERVTINVVALPTHNNEARQVFKNNQQTILTDVSPYHLPPWQKAAAAKLSAAGLHARQ